LDLATHIVQSKTGHFDPKKFDDRYEDALKELLRKKQAGQKIEVPKEPTPAKVINLMDALRRSVETERRPVARSTAQRRAPKKAGRSSARRKKAG
jgi:DNA end-binding protein Ku